MMMRVHARQVARSRLVAGTRDVTARRVEFASVPVAFVLARGNGLGARNVMLVAGGSALRRGDRRKKGESQGDRKTSPF
jgi:hypothetical protein